MEEIVIDKIIKSRRKTISLEVSEKGEVIVRAPFFVTESRVKKFVAEKSKWLQKAKKRAEGKQVVDRTYTHGEEFLYLGHPYKLLVVAKSDKKFEFSGAFILRKDSIGKAKELFEKWYRDSAREYFTERLDYFSQLSGSEYIGLRLNKAKTRWGSCSRKGYINLNFKLIMADVEIIDYVILHEMMHIEHKNHAKSFWNDVSKYMPDFKERRKWLKDNGHTLTF